MVYTKSARATHLLLENANLDVFDVAHVTAQIDRVVYRQRPTTSAMIRQTPKTNNATIAIFVTSQARLRLFSILEEAVQKGNEPLYCDTGF